MEGVARDEQLRTLARRQVRTHCRHGARAIGIEQQYLQWFPQVMMVELVGAYSVHDYLGVGSDEKVEGRAIGTLALVGFRQCVGRNPQRASVGLGDEAACG